MGVFFPPLLASWRDFMTCYYFLLSLRQPPVSESHWRMLLQDMLAMQQNVYTCLEPEACYEVTHGCGFSP